MAELEEMDGVYKELIEQDRCRKEAIMPKRRNRDVSFVVENGDG